MENRFSASLGIVLSSGWLHAKFLKFHGATPGTLKPREGKSSILRDSLNLKLYDRILDDASIPCLEKQVLLYLTFRSNESFKCWPCQRTMARQLVHSRPRICAAIVWLRKMQFLTSKQIGRVTFYDMSLSATRYLSPGVTPHVIPRDTEVEVKKQTSKTPLPPADAGEQYFCWQRETIGVQMGRRRRLPDLGSYQGAQAARVVDFLNHRGFAARIVRTQ